MNQDDVARVGPRNQAASHADELDHMMSNLRARIQARRPATTHADDDLAETASVRIEAARTHGVQRALGNSAGPSLAIEEVFQRVRELAKAKTDPIGESSGQDLAAYGAPLRLAEQLTVSSPPPLAFPNFSRDEYPRISASLPAIVSKDVYDLNEILAFSGADFIANAYRALLRREPDLAGCRAFLGELISGRLSKIEILAILSTSPEGTAAGVRVSGLRKANAFAQIRRMPIIGRLLALAYYLITLPRVVGRLDRLEAGYQHNNLEVREAFNSLGRRAQFDLADFARASAASIAGLATRSDADRIAERQADTGRWLRRLGRQTGQIEARLVAKADSDAVDLVSQRLDKTVAKEEFVRESELIRAETNQLSSMISELKAQSLKTGATLREDLKVISNALAAKTDRAVRDADLVRLGQTLAVHEQRLDSLKRIEELVAELGGRTQHYRTMVLDQERRVSKLLEALEASHQGVVSAIKTASLQNYKESLLDPLYLSFEDQFRGTREDIKGRVSVYLPILAATCARTTDRTVLDIGCGRGEWLELLQENKYDVRGVDLNDSMVQQCLERELPVSQGDALAYLRELPNEALSAITGMHIIEHVSFASLISLLDEAMRVLRPGGVVIFETPNPENIIVGSCGFWNDPTHVRPLPPEPMRFLVAERGFVDVEIMRLHPHSDLSTRQDGSADMGPRLRELLFGPQDYSIIGHRP